MGITWGHVCPPFLNQVDDSMGWQHPPKIVQIDITSRCNLACRHCRASVLDTSVADLSLDQITSLMTDIHSLSPHAALAVAGGEPLMRPDLKEIFYFIQNNLSGMNIELLSNVTLIDQDNIGWLMDTVRGFNISMEGATPLVHDAVRGRGTFQRTVQALKLLVGQGAVVAVRMTYFHQGEDESENLMRFIQDIRISMFNSRYLVPVGRASEKKVDADQYRRLSERIWEVGRELGIKVGYSDPFPELLVNEKRKKEIDDNVDLLEGVAGCSIAFTLQYITPQGTGGAVSLFSCLCCRYTRRKA